MRKADFSFGCRRIFRPIIAPAVFKRRTRNDCKRGPNLLVRRAEADRAAYGALYEGSHDHPLSLVEVLMCTRRAVY